MSKPEWNEDTPKWANWLAQDQNGDWWWYQHKPCVGVEGFKPITDINALARRGAWFIKEWKETLEPRP